MPISMRSSSAYTMVQWRAHLKKLSFRMVTHSCVQFNLILSSCSRTCILFCDILCQPPQCNFFFQFCLLLYINALTLILSYRTNPFPSWYLCTPEPSASAVLVCVCVPKPAYAPWLCLLTGLSSVCGIKINLHSNILVHTHGGSIIGLRKEASPACPSTLLTGGALWVRPHVLWPPFTPSDCHLMTILTTGISVHIPYCSKHHMAIRYMVYHVELTFSGITEVGTYGDNWGYLMWSDLCICFSLYNCLYLLTCISFACNISTCTSHYTHLRTIIWSHSSHTGQRWYNHQWDTSNLVLTPTTFTTGKTWVW